VEPALTNLWGNARRLAGICFLALLLHGCALITPQTTELRANRPADLPDRAELSDVPFFPQQEYQCGPAALATALAGFDIPVTPEDLVGQVYLPARKGSLQVEMLAAPRRYGMVSYQLAPRFEDVLREVSAGTPVIVLQDYGVWPVRLWHYAVVAGYDYPKDEVVLRSGMKQRLTMPFGILEYIWKESGYWAMVAVPPDRIPATATESQYLAAVSAMARVGNAQAVKTAYSAFLERWPGNLAAAIGLANAHYTQGELGEAEAVLRRTADHHPDSVAVLNNLAQTISDLGRHDEALRLIDQAVARKSSFAGTVDETRQQILQRMGKSQE